MRRQSFVLLGRTQMNMGWIFVDKELTVIPLDIVCLMETCVFPEDRALVNVQNLAFCVQLNAEENIFVT